MRAWFGKDHHNIFNKINSKINEVFEGSEKWENKEINIITLLNEGSKNYVKNHDLFIINDKKKFFKNCELFYQKQQRKNNKRNQRRRININERGKKAKLLKSISKNYFEMEIIVSKLLIFIQSVTIITKLTQSVNFIKEN